MLRERWDQESGSYMHGPEMSLGVLDRWWQAAPPSHWEHMVLPPEIEVCGRSDDHPQKDGCGIYALFGEDDGLQYIGKASDLSARMLQHWYGSRNRREAWYSQYACLQLPPHAVHDVEVAHIHALEPPCNRLYEIVRWDRHHDMVKLIQETWGPKR